MTTNEETLKAANVELEAENRALRSAISAMHRRAQANDGAVHRLAKAKARFEAELARQREVSESDEDGWARDNAELRMQWFTDVRNFERLSLWGHLKAWFAEACR